MAGRGSVHSIPIRRLTMMTNTTTDEGFYYNTHGMQ